MLVTGEWQLRDDGVMRPIMRARVLGRVGHATSENFLIDSGADRTVLSAVLLSRLRLPIRSTAPDSTLSGIGGTSDFVLVTTAIEFMRDDGGSVQIRGEFAGFTDPRATDVSVLGRDVLDNFDLIIGRHRTTILLLAPRHRYHVDRE
jgi:Aspartyl protease